MSRYEKINELLSGSVFESNGAMRITGAKAFSSAVEIAMRQNDEMVDHISALEETIAGMASGEVSGAYMKRVRFAPVRPGDTRIKALPVYGSLPNSFTATNCNGVVVKAVVKVRIEGGGHGEGPPYPVQYVEYEYESRYYMEVVTTIFDIVG